MFGFNPQQVTQQVTDGAQQMVQQAGGGLFSRFGSMLSGGFSGIIGGALTWGPLLFVLQSTGAIRPIANAIGGEELAERVASLGQTGDGVDNIGRRVAAVAAMGAAMGAAGGATRGLVMGPPREGSNGGLGAVVGIGGALVAAAVMMRSQSGGSERPESESPTSAPPAPAAEAGRGQ